MKLSKPLLIVLVTITLVFSITFLAIYADKMPVWSGLSSYMPQNVTQGYERGKTLWDWMDLLLVPLGLAYLAFLLNRIEKERDEVHFRDTTFHSYLDSMTHLLLEEGLLTSDDKSEIRTLARARTLMALRALDSKRKGIIVQFLYEG